MRKTFFILPLVFFLIFGIFFYLLSTDRNPSEIPSNLLNKTVPIFEAESLFKNEKFISLNEFKDEITLVNFFATWCKPCRDEHIYIKRFADQKNIKVIGINYKDNQKKTKKWLNDLGNPYKDILIDQNGNIAIDWGVYGIPETFIINSNGIIKYRHVGPITEKEFKKINLLISQNE
tara:strand:- start:201 stop:728 length:528 start_codon:yes stop_codon:yes gene_type:complete